MTGSVVVVVPKPDVEGSGALGELFEDVLVRAREHVRREREAVAAAEQARLDVTV